MKLPHPSLLLMALGLSLAACSLSPPQPMNPEAMAKQIAHCHSLGLRADELSGYSSAGGGNIIVTGIQCRTTADD